MKKMILVVLGFVVYAFSAEAKPATLQQKPPAPPCPMMANMQMPCPIAGLMHSVIDVAKTGQKLLAESKGIGNNALMAELEQKIAALDKQMGDMKCCMPAPKPAAVQTPSCPMQNGTPCTMRVKPLE